MTTLLERFPATECTPYVRDLVLTALEAGRSATGPRRKRFELDLFELTFDLDEGEVVIEDLLNASEAGAQRVRIEEFSGALETMRG